MAAAVGGLVGTGSNVASTSQYGVGSKAWISFSRRTRIASVGVCTRPSETTVLPNAARPRIVAARVAFMPTSQSASERERAAASSGASSLPGRRWPKAWRIASLVIDENQARCTGTSFLPATSST